jgi:RNA polymerase sigma-70 factor (ECF subfamily)
VSDLHTFITRLYEEYSDRIYRYALWQVGDPAIAEDITAEVFVRAFRHHEQLAEGSYQQAWLYRVAKNLIIDQARRKQPVPLDDTEPQPAATNVAAEAQAQDEAEALRKLVGELPPDMRSVVTLRFFEHLAVQEVARILDKTPANVRVLQYRALKLLKVRLDNNE